MSTRLLTVEGTELESPHPSVADKEQLSEEKPSKPYPKFRYRQSNKLSILPKDKNQPREPHRGNGSCGVGLLNQG